MRVTRNDNPDECSIHFQTITSEEVHAIYSALESQFVLREGYEVTCLGTCSKGPQGLWWSVIVSGFESLDGFHAAEEILERFST